MTETTNDATTPCWIYRSSKKDEMYLYLATRTPLRTFQRRC